MFGHATAAPYRMNRSITPFHEPRRSRRKEAHFFSNPKSQSLLTSAPTVQGFNARSFISVNSLPVRRRERVSLCAAGLLLFAATRACAETILLAGATVHTVSGPVHSPGMVLIQDGKIAAVDVSLPLKADKIVNLKGLHLYPGLIAATSSLGLLEIGAVRSTVDTTEVGSFTPDVQSWIAVNPDSELLPVARANGITHFLAVPEGKGVSGQSGLMAMTGWTFEQMAVKRPVALHLFWPGMELNTTPKEHFKDKAKWKSLDDQARERRKTLKEIEDFFDEARAYVKSRAAGGKAAQPTGAPAWDAMVPFVVGEIPLMIHANEIRQIKAAVAWCDARGYRMILAGGREAAQAAGLLAAKKIPVIYENVFTQPARDTDAYEAPFRAPELLRQAGVKVVISMGTGATGATLARNLPYAAAQAVAFGLPPDEGLKAITLYPAQVLGVADRLGSLEAGKEATVFAADGDVLDIRSNVKRMWIAGQEVSLESRHTRLYEKYRQRPRSP